MNRFLLTACLFGGLIAPAWALEDAAQVPYGDSEGVRATYSAASAAYAGYATPTDVSCINGSATKQVRVSRVGFSGRANSATALDVLLYKRTAADTSGTPATLVAVLHDSTNTTASAAVVTYGTAPSITGLTTQLVRAQIVILPASASSGAGVGFEWDFGNVNDQSVVLRGTAQGLCVNLNGATNPAGAAYNFYWEWIEETTSQQAP